MRSNKLHGLKPQIIKYMAMLMGICYLMNPLQQQVNTVLHTIAHKLTPPASIASHQNVHSQFAVHQSPDHYAPNSEHDHKIVDLVNTIFEASNDDDDQSESDFVDNKWDKHISSSRFKFINPEKTAESKAFWITKNHLINGHSKKSKEPPQKLLS